MIPSEYKIYPSEKSPGVWNIMWVYEKEDETFYFFRQFRRRTNAMIYLARLKDNQISEQQQLRFLKEREKK